MSGSGTNRCVRSTRGGMTLLEVVLAVTISVGLMGSVLGFYHHALDVRESLERKIQAVESTRRAMERITDELRSAIGDPTIGIGLEGLADELTFVCVNLPGPGTWAIRTGDEEPVPPSHDLAIVGYRLRIEEEDQSGETVVAGLERTVQRILTMRVTEEEQDIGTSLLGPDIAFVGFRYWDDGTWVETWSGSDLPRAIEITLGTEPLDEGDDPEEYQYEVFRRVVYLPGRAISPESMARGPSPEEEEI